MKSFICLIVLTIAWVSSYSRDACKPDPLIDIIHYDFNISISDSNDSIRAGAVIRINFRDQTGAFDLDLKNINNEGKGMIVSLVSFTGGEIRWNHKNDKLSIELVKPAKSGSTGELTVKYSGIPADGLIISKNKFGSRTFFSDHWPDRARNYLPCVDHPSEKATVDFIITSPSHYKVVANGYLTEESDLVNGLKLTHWREDVPLSMKVMAFAAASFAVQLAGNVDGTPVWTWVYPENRKEGFYDYSAALKPLALFKNLIGPYSYEKLADVQSKTIFGGMENAGCIFYAENSVTGQGKAESLLAHEIAHQWFGNSVTEKDWHHIWLSEGFATYLEAVYMEKTYGTEKFRQTMSAARDRILRSDQRNPGCVIDTTITDLMKLLNAYSYQKGAWVLHMLRQEVGEDNFWNGIRLYYNEYRNRNALSDDFKKIMETVSGKNLDSFFREWLYYPGMPQLKISIGKDAEKGYSDIVIEQTQTPMFSFKIDLRIEYNNDTIMKTAEVSGRYSRVKVKSEKILKLIPDPESKLLFRSISQNVN